jgi:tryptophanyl-tRNA synthetase
MSTPVAPTKPKKRVLSGVQSSGTQHIGNYLGALRQHVTLQDDHDARYFIADYHSMTTVHDPAVRRGFSREIALDYLGLGLDPKRAILYRQSDVIEVVELMWVLATVAPMGLLERSHAYKDALANGKAAEAGLFMYPVLMAADILIHRADCVPVGDDQKQHIEIARDLAVKFNLRYREILHLPEPMILPDVGTVPGTDGRKMSKSYGNTIQMFAPERELKKQVMGIVTDSMPVEQPKDPSKALFQIWRHFATPEEWECMRAKLEQGGTGYGDVKKDLLKRVLEHFAVARARRDEWATRPDDVEDVLADGAKRAREQAAGLLVEIRDAAGIGPPRRK